MFNNPVFGFSSQANGKFLPQDLAGLGLNNIPPQQKINSGSFQFPSQQTSLDFGGYVPPSIDNSQVSWPKPDQVDPSYQRGATVVRQYNNSSIDDYYKKFLRPITDYIALPTNGQPTYVYQNLGGGPSSTNIPTTTGLIDQPVGELKVGSHSSEAVPILAQPKDDRSEEKKHKKKHKKRSSKHTDSEKKAASSKVKESDGSDDHHQISSISAPLGQQQAQVTKPVVLSETGAVGPQVPMKLASNPVVYFDIHIDNEERGRLVIELFRQELPRTTENFLSLTLNKKGVGYRLSYFHRIIPGFMAQAGDFEKSNGTGGYSIYGDKFDDEGFPFPHDRAGLLSMANSGPNTNGSQFFITLDSCPHLDNKHVVFGQVLQGFHLLEDLDLCGSESGEVVREVKIAKTGQIQ